MLTLLSQILILEVRAKLQSQMMKNKNYLTYRIQISDKTF